MACKDLNYPNPGKYKHLKSDKVLCNKKLTSISDTLPRRWHRSLDCHRLFLYRMDKSDSARMKGNASVRV